MKSAAKNIQIASYDDLFKTDAERQADAQERVQSLPLDQLVPFPNHPFKMLDDDKMLETVESIRDRGVLVPILVRPQNDGTFQIVSGHRRHHASLLAGKTEIPAIVRDMDDDIQSAVSPPSRIFSGSAKCSSHRTRLNGSFCRKVWRTGWRFTLISATTASGVFKITDTDGAATNSTVRGYFVEPTA